MALKILAMDLDDTLLRKDLSISDRTVCTLRRAAAKGFLPVIASGRAPRAVEPFAQRIGSNTMQSYLVCSNGAEIITSDSGKRIYERTVPPDTAIKAWRMCEAAGLSCHIYGDSCIYVSRETEFSARDSHLSKLKIIVPEDYEKLVASGVYKLVIPGNPEFITAVEAEFKTELNDAATVFVSKPYFMEVLPPHSGKGEALRFLAEQILHIDSADIIAFGDSMNDESMIKYAGCSVAMCNGREEIKRLARFITEKSNDEDGIALHLETHFGI
ncbi:MAG: Cof-type HAD-IIB family hydrolase [Bacteroides sp.]|nr:Cof-type HAD-IIB family hydrolase [Prevotella sp.]MCM1407565.1 Cof-type HAD-IIB family hydrolase [Treponema brennaborense]MCM1469285.1 Cof-type HAD-IIB family hydrolase [Bacteroides sp.]